MHEQVRVANITGGPLDYSYPVHSVSLHFGLRDNSGSEHTVDGKSFPGEVQFKSVIAWAISSNFLKIGEF